MSLPFNLRFNYNADTARRDLVAGATVAAIAIPQAMAYALIAGVDPRFGLYSAIVVTLIASIFGSSSHLINGPTNAISLVVFSSLSSFDARFDAYQALFLLGIFVGVIQILISVFKLGDLTRYISESVVLGFMAGAGLLVAIGQVGNFIGVTKTGGADHSVLVRLWETLTQSGPYNLIAIGLGLGTLVAALLLRRVINKYKLPQMDMLVALIVASAIATYFGWSIPKPDGKAIISVVGTVPAALPSFHIPEINFEWVTRLAGSALAISFLGLLEALAVAKSIATHTRQPLDYNRQCMAEGLGNLVGGFFQSLPGSGSLTRSAINYQSGAITRMSGIYSSIIVGIAVLGLGPYARFIPKSALAGLLFITAARLIDWKRLAYAIRASRFDAALVFVTAFAAIFISVEDSILIGVAVSLLLFVPRVSKLGIRELIVTPENRHTPVLKNSRTRKESRSVRSILRFCSSATFPLRASSLADRALICFRAASSSARISLSPSDRKSNPAESRNRLINPSQRSSTGSPGNRPASLRVSKASSTRLHPISGAGQRTAPCFRARPWAIKFSTSSAEWSKLRCGFRPSWANAFPREPFQSAM
jgi:sulfate permease, SulP family